LKIKSILVSQPKPETAKSPYYDLAEHSAVIFTSRTAIDHFFRIAQEMRLTVPDSMKYFCISEATAFYLQKYIVYRKRKIFYGNGKFSDLINVMKKHKDEKFLVPLSDIHKQQIPDLLDKGGYKYTKAVLYRTVSSDLSDLKDVNYDILVFFSPSGIRSLFDNFPDFEQNNTRIACFGPTTAKAVKEAGLRLDIQAPTAKSPSMTMALEQYIKKVNKGD
jgi:uroporphyrinogen-III synthase